MKTVTMVFTIIIVVSLINIIDANQRKRVSDEINLNYLLFYICLVFK
jgi:hypothetical protein